MIFASVQIILCDGANSYVDANAWDEIQGFHVYCLYFKLEWSSKCKAEQGQELFCACTCASVKGGVML